MFFRGLGSGKLNLAIHNPLIGHKMEQPVIAKYRPPVRDWLCRPRRCLSRSSDGDGRHAQTRRRVVAPGTDRSEVLKK
jgi:hypothetical protein